MTERTAHAGVPRHALAAGAIAPGAGHLWSGAPRTGLVLLLSWAICPAIALWRWDRVQGAWSASLDHRIALGTLILLPACLWAWGMWDLAVRRRRPARQGGDSQWVIARRRLRRNPLALIGLATIVLLYLVALLAPFLAPYDPIAQTDIVRLANRPPSAEFLLGTDRFGRDVLSRIIYGARISLAIGFVATAISMTVGTAIGAAGGYFGRVTDAVLMRFTDVVLAFPRLILLILCVALFEPSLTVIILVLGLTQWPSTTRIVRGEVLSLREREFVQAARALGFGDGRIILRHVLPNVLAPIIVTATLGIGNTIVMEAGLAFLGLGVPPPTPTWGDMVAAGRENLIGAWWVTTFPGFAIVLVVLAFNLLGDGLRDALDPRG